VKPPSSKRIAAYLVEEEPLLGFSAGVVATLVLIVALTCAGELLEYALGWREPRPGEGPSAMLARANMVLAGILLLSYAAPVAREMARIGRRTRRR